MIDSGDPREIELKFHLSPDALPRLLEHRLLRRLSTGNPVRKRLVSTYFDTPDFRLMRARVALRVRKIDNRRIQSVKCAPRIEDGIHSRREWEREVTADRPVLKGIGDKKLRKLLSAGKVRDRLAPQFVTDIERATWPLKLRNTRVELAVDIGEIKSPKGSVPVCEAELELKSGSIDGVYELARALHKSIPFTIEPLTKAERGFALLTAAPPRPQRAKEIELPNGCTLGEAFARIGRSCLLHLRANEASVRAARSTESVHQFRVALRRLRSALSAFRDLLPSAERRKVGRDLRWIAREFGRAREWDVFHDEVLADVRKVMARDRSLIMFTEAVAAARDEAFSAVAQTILSPRYTESMLRLESWWEGRAWAEAFGASRDEDARDYARRTLKKLHRRVLKLGETIPSLNEADLHMLRLRAKKLRYVAEFFRSLYPAKATKAYISALAQIQERLGSLNDAAMVKHLLAELENREQKMDRAIMARASGVLAGWSAARVKSDLKSLPDAWERFAALRPFWK
jgi:inorganic triphosphatase YgiF